MMPNKVYNITLRLVKTPAEAATLEPVFASMGSDWLRMNIYSWYVWTDKSADELRKLLAPHVNPEDSYLILAVDPSDRHGWAPKFVWDWFDDKVQQQQQQLTLPFLARGAE